MVGGAWQAHRFLSRDEDTIILIPGTIFVLVSATFVLFHILFVTWFEFGHSFIHSFIHSFGIIVPSLFRWRYYICGRCWVWERV